MNVIRYNNFTEFYQAFAQEFSHSKNQRLNKWFNMMGTLNQGCGCTRRQRMKYCSIEYNKTALVLKPENIQLMKMKHQNTKFEFAEGGEVFHVIKP